MDTSPITSDDSLRWQAMQNIVSQYSKVFQPRRVLNFKKLVLGRFLAENLLVLLLQYVSLTLSTLTQHATPIWLASGTACAFIFLRGYSILPGIWLGSILAFVLARVDFSLALECATIYAAQTWLLLLISYRYISPTLLFYRALDFIKFIVCSALLTVMTSMLLEYFCYSSLQSPLPATQVFFQWWLANFSGIIVLASAIIAWDAYFPQLNSLKPQVHKPVFWLTYGLFLFLILLLLFSDKTLWLVLFSISTFPVIMVIGRYFSWCGVITAICSFGLLLNFSIYFDIGFFANNSSFATLIFLQLLLCMQVVIGFFISDR